MRAAVIFVLLCFFAGINTAYAQPDNCPAEIDTTMIAARDSCDELERNQVCYGNYRIDAETSESADLVFTDAGDVISVGDLETLKTYPLVPDTDDWGIALFNVQASLPNTIPGQNVMLIVFGDAELEPDPDAPEDYQGPMQAFYMQTGIGLPVCKTVPEGGVLVQNPREHPVTLLVNQYELRVGSTALLTAETTNDLTISTLEGNVQVTIDGEEQSIPAGFTLSLVPDTVPELPEPDAELEVELSELLPEVVPQPGEPAGETISLLGCANSGGVDVAAGSTVTLRGGWADFELAGVLDFAANTPPSLDYDGESLPYSHRAGPSPWSNDNGEGFAINWFWVVEDIATGTHNAVWLIAGETLVCEIRAG